MIKEIEVVVKRLEALSSVEREVVNSLWDSLSGLREYFTQISFTMTNYDQWALKQKITNLESSIQKLNLKIPRTKFRFKRKRETQEKAKRGNTDDKEKQDEFTNSIKGLVDLKDKNLVLRQEDLEGSFKLVNLENCEVRFEGSINMLFLRNLTNCKVFSCPVSNSIMGHNLINCTVSMIGHQIRLHDSYDTHFYVHTTSKLIIEDCARLVFHEIQYQYDGLEKDIETAGLKGVNLWKEVQDFKWIKVEQSPNFSLAFDGREKATETDYKPVMHNAPVVQPKVIEQKKPQKVDVEREQKTTDDIHSTLGFIATPGQSTYKTVEVPVAPTKKVEKKEAEEVVEEKKDEGEKKEDDDEIDEI